MANSWILAGALWEWIFGYADPKNLSLSPEIETFCKNATLPIQWQYTQDCKEACTNAEICIHDVWVSMGYEEEENDRMEKMSPLPSDSGLTSNSSQREFILYALYARPSGEEVTQEVLSISSFHSI